MKKIIISALLFITTISYSQKVEKESYFSVSIGGDIKNSTVGSAPTDYKASPDILIGLHCVGNNFELNPEIETFNKIGYFSSGLNFGYHLQRYIPENIIPFAKNDIDLTIVPLVGFKMINRYGFEDKETSHGFIYGKSSHIAIQGGLSFRIPLSDKILIDIESMYSTRPDINYRWGTNKTGVLSNFISFHYIIN